MKSRRAFFRQFAAIAATVALAPKIAFGVQKERVSSLGSFGLKAHEEFLSSMPDLQDLSQCGFWYQPAWWTGDYSPTYIKYRNMVMEAVA